MDSTDKIKILLEDFREKEALNREEIGEIEKQIGELEQLVEASKERMERVNADKEKVYMMRNRYAEGDWSDVLAKASEKIKSESSTAKSDSDTNGGVSTVSTETIDVPVVKAKVDTDSQNTEANLFEPSSAPSLPESVPIPTPYKEPVNQELSSSPGSVAIPTPPDEANTGFQEPVQEVNLPGGYIPGLSASDHDVLPVALDNPDKPPILPGIPNPPTGFDAMQVPPGLPNMAMPKAQGPVEETKESSLFPFNQGPEMSSDLDQDSPWSGMTWESSGNSEQVEEIQTANVPPQQPQQVQPIQQVQPLQQIQTPGAASASCAHGSGTATANATANAIAFTS